MDQWNVGVGRPVRHTPFVECPQRRLIRAQSLLAGSWKRGPAVKAPMQPAAQLMCKHLSDALPQYRPEAGETTTNYATLPRKKMSYLKEHTLLRVHELCLHP